MTVIDLCDECAKFGHTENLDATCTIQCHIWKELEPVYNKYGVCITISECDEFYSVEDAELNAEPCDEECYLFRRNQCESRRGDNRCDREQKPTREQDNIGARLHW